MSKKTDKSMPCGHPKACVVSSKDGTSYCAWCEDSGKLRAEREAALALLRGVSENLPEDIRPVHFQELPARVLVGVCRIPDEGKLQGFHDALLDVWVAVIAAVSDAAIVAHKEFSVVFVRNWCVDALADLKKRVETIERERDEARKWVRNMTKKTQTLTCVYCGKAYPPGSPTHGAKVLTKHIKICPKHPMRESEAEIERLRRGIKKIAANVRSRHSIYLSLTSGPMIRPKPGVAEAYDEAAIFAESEAERVLTNDQSGTVAMSEGK